MDKSYKPLTPPDKTAYEPYIKPKYVDDKTPSRIKKKFKAKKAKPKPLYRVCEKCGNIISDIGLCDFCGHHSNTRILTTLIV